MERKRKVAAMLRIHCLVLSLQLVLLPSVLLAGDDSPGLSKLKEKGLTRSGRFLVLTEAEKSAIDQWKEARVELNKHLAVSEQIQEAEQNIIQLEQSSAALQQTLSQLNRQSQRMNQQRSGYGGRGRAKYAQQYYRNELNAERSMIQRNLSGVKSMQQMMKSKPGMNKKNLDAENRRSLEAARALLTELRESVDDVTRQYHQLDSDPSVRSAFQVLEKEKLGALKLGPSTEFSNMVKSLAKAEHLILGEKTTIPVQQKGKKARKSRTN